MILSEQTTHVIFICIVLARVRRIGKHVRSREFFSGRVEHRKIFICSNFIWNDDIRSNPVTRTGIPDGRVVNWKYFCTLRSNWLENSNWIPKIRTQVVEDRGTTVIKSMYMFIWPCQSQTPEHSEGNKAFYFYLSTLRMCWCSNHGYKIFLHLLKCFSGVCWYVVVTL